MSRKGNCWDSRRRILLQQFEERADQETDLQEPRIGDHRRGRYIEMFYNRMCRHRHLGGLSPAQFEAAHSPQQRGFH
jgi:putative transposase